MATLPFQFISPKDLSLHWPFSFLMIDMIFNSKFNWLCFQNISLLTTSTAATLVPAITVLLVTRPSASTLASLYLKPSSQRNHFKTQVHGCHCCAHNHQWLPSHQEEKKSKCPHNETIEAQHHLLPVPFVPISHTLFLTLCWTLRAFATSVPSVQNVLLPDTYMACYLQIFTQMSPHRWGLSYDNHPTSPLPSTFYPSSLLSLSLPATNPHLPYGCLFPLCRKDALGGWDDFLRCSLLNPQNLTSCLTQGRHLV